MRGNRESDYHSGHRGVDTRLMHEIPEHESRQQIWPQMANAHCVESNQNEEHHGRASERAPCDRTRIKNRDDENRAHVIDDGKGGQKYLRTDWCARGDQRERS